MPTKLDVPILKGGNMKMKTGDMRNVKTTKPTQSSRNVYSQPKNNGAKKVSIQLPPEMTTERVPEAQPLPESSKNKLQDEVNTNNKVGSTSKQISKTSVQKAISWLYENDYISEEQNDKAEKFLSEWGPTVSFTLDSIVEVLPFLIPALGAMPKTMFLAKALAQYTPILTQGRKYIKKYTGYGVSDKKQLAKNVQKLLESGVSKTRINNELKKFEGGALTVDELTKLLTEGSVSDVEKEFGKPQSRGYKSGNKLKWVEALKIWNEGREMYCVPKKGTKEYNEVKEIMVNGV